MQNDWMLDVLADLKSFAATNGLAAIEDQLDRTIHVAHRDLTSGVTKVPANVGRLSEETGPRRDARGPDP